MQRATSQPFRSEFGFSSPSFSVDEDGNIVANSITAVLQGSGGSVEPDHVFTESLEGDLIVDGSTQSAIPSLNFIFGRSYQIELNLDTIRIVILQQDQTTEYNNISHSDGTSGELAQRKSTGKLTITIPEDFDQQTLYFTNVTRDFFGVINLKNQDGIFNTITVNSTDNAESPITGSLTVSGGAGIQKDLYVNGDFFVGGIGIPQILSPTNLKLGADNKIIIEIEGNDLGEINSQGSTIPVTDTTINNSVIGNSTPSAAIFSQASVNNVTNDVNSIPNRLFVENTATAFAIAFGS